MIRSIHQLVIGTALLTLFLSMSAVNVQASAGPCDAGDGQLDATVCVNFLAYVRDSIAFENESIALTIPESTVASHSLDYAHNWDANPVAYIPESTMMREAARYVPHWDDNNVAYIPESTMDISPEKVLGFQNVGR